VCLIALGENERAKELLHAAKGSELSRQGSHARVLDLAILYCRITEPASALTILSELDVESLPAFFRANYHAIRASAFFLLEDDAKALFELDKARGVGLTRELEPGCFSLEALVRYEQDGDRQRALALSKKAMQVLPALEALRAPVVVNHAYLLLECGDTQGALDAIHAAIGHETELGSSGRAVYHYVLARCYFETGMLSDVRQHLDDALEQPMPKRLKSRIADFDERVRTGRPPAGLEP
jgi:tetratricopeptide (TPR) repeat protein